MTKRLRPFFGYFGSKWRLAKRYPSPQHGLIIEPFAGSAQYAMMYHDKDVLLYDSDPLIVELWTYLINTPSDEILALPDLKVGQRVDDLDIPTAAKSLVGFWLGSGLTHPNQTITAWMKNPMYQSRCQWWGQAVRERIASQQQYIRHWQVEQSSYVDLDNQHACWFIDPPYQGAGKYYRHSAKSIDFPHLGEWCQSRQGQVIVCENSGASWLPFRPLCSTRGTLKSSKEVIYTKGSLL